VYDVAVVGAGVVGLACARALTSRGRTVLVIERHARFGQETSSRNSGVIHAGIYYAPGSLKAQTCIAGNPALYRWCQAHDVPHRAIGKFLVATSADEEPALEKLLARAHENGAVEVTRCSLAELARQEPSVRARAALWSPRTGIVDVHAFMRSLQAASTADHAWRQELVAAHHDSSGWRLTTRAGETVTAAAVVNAAGLDADEVSALAGFSHRQSFVKGNYFALRRGELKHLIYPIPPPDLAGVGIHVTLAMDGAARLGPDVEPISRERDYRVDPSRAGAFFAAASRYLTGIQPEDLTPDYAGIRPKVGGGDFIVEARDAWINLIGIESPGLTASLVLAERVAALLP
jgi:L-2-hydroxyglutarate oxidase LhgO